MSACPHTDNPDKCECYPGCGCDNEIAVPETAEEYLLAYSMFDAAPAGMSKAELRDQIHDRIKAHRAASGFTRVLPVHIPTVAYKAANVTDAQAFRKAADNLDQGYPLGGGNLTDAVKGLLRAAAGALDASREPDPPWSFYDYQQRRAAFGE